MKNGGSKVSCASTDNFKLCPKESFFHNVGKFHLRL